MITACVFTMSDSGFRGERTDEGGPIVMEMLKAIGVEVRLSEIVPDEKDIIKKRLMECSAVYDLIVTTGGTGLSPRDVTPDATLEVIERQVPGIAEAMRAEGLGKTKRAMLSRAVAGVRGGALIINLPGSPKGVRESLGAIIDVIPHAVEKIRGGTEDCGKDE